MQAQVPEINYEISKIDNDSISKIKVISSFKPNENGITKLYYSDRAWGQKDLYKCLESVKVLSEKGKIVKNKDSGWLMIEHPKKLKEISVEYILKQDTEKEMEMGKIYRPVIQEEYFHILSHNLFMIPETLDDIANVSLEWQNFPKNYTIHNSFGSNRRKQRMENMNLNDFISAIFLGGDYRVYPIKIEENNVYYATRGDWMSFQDSQIVGLLSNAIQFQRDFWNDHTQKYFTVTLSPSAYMENGSVLQGTSLTNSFQSSATNNKNTKLEKLTYLFNHELMHNWIGKIISNDNEVEQYWFSEGFTEYYTHKNIAKSKQNDEGVTYFTSELNEIIAGLYTSELGEEPNNKITEENFWGIKEYKDLPYNRGALFAFYLDQKIRKDSKDKHSLDNLMMDFLNDARETGQTISHDYFVKKANKYLDQDLSSFFDNHIEKGKLLKLAEIFSEFDLNYVKKAKVYDRGFTYSGDFVIESVNENSEAQKAGFKKGDIILEYSIHHDFSEPSVIKISRDGKKQEIAYYPFKEIELVQLETSQDISKLGL
ncbi:hypothetical protein GCM10022258_43670 [Aquimarina gracilis]